MISKNRSFVLITLGIAAMTAGGFWVISQIRSARHHEQPAALTPVAPQRPETPSTSAATDGRSRPKAGEGASLEDAGTPPAPRAPTRPPKEIASIRAQILDERAPDQKRLDALRELRVCSDDWKDGLIVSSMSRLIRTSEVDGIRMNICRALRGADTMEFRQQLLTSVVSDASSGVRREAVASLRLMAADPVVQQTLRKALESERNAGVKTEIERTLTAAKVR